MLHYRDRITKLQLESERFENSNQFCEKFTMMWWPTVIFARWSCFTYVYLQYFPLLQKLLFFWFQMVSIFLQGYECHKCNLFVHKACFEKYVKTCKTCPGCKISWTGKNMVKRVRQAADGTADATSSQSNVASTSRGGRRPATTSQSGTTNHEMPVLQPMISSPKNKRSTRGQAKGKSKSPSPQASPAKGSPAKKKGKAPSTRGKRRAAVVSSEEDSD